MKTKVKSNIKNNLKKYRTWKNLTQQELADELEISVGLVRIIELNNHYPKYYTRWKLYTYFGVSQRQMFYEEV
jgi:transcriptional regulator with XRE-family HTH domain